MNKPTRFPEEFKIEADMQLTERGHRVSEVAARLVVSQHSLYAWIKRYSKTPEFACRAGLAIVTYSP